MSPRTDSAKGAGVVGRPPKRLHVVVIGDLLVDVVVNSTAPLGHGRDVLGDIQFRQGGSAGTTARWSARLGARTSLITAVGRDAFGDALIAYMQRCEVVVHAVRPAGLGTGRMGVLLDGGRRERSFVADRRAATSLVPSAITRSWLAGAQAVHVPAYCLFDDPLASATSHAVRLARQEGALLSVDLSSASFILRCDPAQVRDRIAALEPHLVVTTVAEARALLGHSRLSELSSVSPLVVVKRGSRGATLLRRSASPRSIEVPAEQLMVNDTTGAGDAFVAGFLTSWLRQTNSVEAPLPLLVQAVRAGDGAAARELVEPRPELLNVVARSRTTG